jgi:hypothetical protein
MGDGQGVGDDDYWKFVKTNGHLKTVMNVVDDSSSKILKKSVIFTSKVYKRSFNMFKQCFHVAKHRIAQKINDFSHFSHFSQTQ